MQPAFHRNGLGEVMLEEIAKRYPHAIGLELYARQANLTAQAFYKKHGFKEAAQFDFKEPQWDENKPLLHLPSDEAVGEKTAAVCVAFSKHLTPILSM